jgi:hypothetical protein
MAKHRDCKWVHKMRIVGVIHRGSEMWLWRTVCIRCGKTGTSLG